MTGCLIYILYAGIRATFHWFLVVAILSILIEGVALMLNKWRCPLTTHAEKWGAEKSSVADIFMPRIIASNLFRLGPYIFGTELILVVVRYVYG